jgi:hypothetical protein
MTPRCRCCKRANGAAHKLSCDYSKNPGLYPRGPEYVSCGKRRYDTEEEAEQELLSCWRKRRRTRIETRYYLCPLCEGYHLTSKPERKAS